MSFDEQFGELVRRERDQVPTGADPSQVLDGLRPEMRRARRLRRLTHAGATALLLVGAVGLARFGAGDGDGSVQIVPADRDGEPTADPRTPTPPIAPSVTTTLDAPADPGDAQRVAEVPDPTSTDGDPPTSSVDVTLPTGSAAPIAAGGDQASDDEPTTTVAVGTDDPPSASNDAPAEPVGGGSPPDEPVDDETHIDLDDPDLDDPDHSADAVAPTSSAPTGAGTPTRFDSECGYVLATVSSGVATIVEIVPATGYRAKVEDPDHGSITVHFEGGGEDCELKIR